MKQFQTNAFFEGKEVKKPKNRSFQNEYDGKAIDELILNCIMTSQEDVEKVMEYLHIHKWCFPATKPQVTNERVYDDENPDYISGTEDGI